MAEQANPQPTRKVAVQAAVTILTWLLMQIAGIEIPAEVGLALNVLFEALVPVIAGFAAAWFVKPSPKDNIVPSK